MPHTNNDIIHMHKHNGYNYIPFCIACTDANLMYNLANTIFPIDEQSEPSHIHRQSETAYTTIIECVKTL